MFHVAVWRTVGWRTIKSPFNSIAVQDVPGGLLSMIETIYFE